MALPPYVDYGSMTTVPAPFSSLNTTLQGFWVEADGERLQALCRKVFSETSGGAVDVRPLGHHVMITWGNIERVVSRTPPFDHRGGVAEPQVAIWVPAATVRERRGRVIAESFKMFVPYIWLDNAMSLATGRELFGYPKSWGWPGFPSATDQGFTLDVFGLDFGDDQLAARHRLFELTPTDPLPIGERALDGLRAVARDIADELFERRDDVHVIPGLHFVEDLLHDLVRELVPGIFLKQFRSVEDGLGAALQQIVAAHCKVTRLRAARLAHRHELTVHQLDSHPVITELGLRSQTTELAYEVEMDFDVGGGTVLWDAHSLRSGGSPIDVLRRLA
jgi:hypothetical protein